MTISEKVLDTVKTASGAISCEEIANHIGQNIFFTKAAAAALRKQGKIRLVAQTPPDAPPRRGCFTGGGLYETTQWYEAK